MISSGFPFCLMTRFFIPPGFSIVILSGVAPIFVKIAWAAFRRSEDLHGAFFRSSCNCSTVDSVGVFSARALAERGFANHRGHRERTQRAQSIKGLILCSLCLL